MDHHLLQMADATRPCSRLGSMIIVAKVRRSFEVLNVEWIERINETMRPHWNTIALVATWLGILFVALRRRFHWARKQFLTQVNFSLNYRVGNSLVMRTLLETTAIRVWPNEYGVSTVLRAAGRTSRADPFILLKKPADRDFVHRAVLNLLSERFADAYVASALGVPVRTATFLFVVTFERFEIMRTQKVRVLLVEESSLRDLFGPGNAAATLDVHNPVYQARLETLQLMDGLLEKEKTMGQPLLGRVELGVVLPGGEPNGPGQEVISTSLTPFA
jgi:hypothetical protein